MDHFSKAVGCRHTARPSPTDAGVWQVVDPPAKSPGNARVTGCQKCNSSSTRLGGQGTLVHQRWCHGWKGGWDGGRGCVRRLHGEQLGGVGGHFARAWQRPPMSTEGH